ncbi:MAG TPA: PAS domain S-box protein, partial [Cyanophyceae cyanobacterium]
MNVLLNKLLSLLAPRRREYLTTDKHFNIVETSLGLQRFVEQADDIAKGTDIRVAFPELIGLEEILSAIIEGQQDTFELNAIARFFDNGTLLYFDLYFINNPDKKTLKGDLIFFLEDVTEKMVLEQTLVQAANEKSLLLEALAVSKDYVDKIITSMADALLITTASGTIKTINQAAQDLFGYTEHELIDQPISRVIKDEEFLRHNALSKGQYSPLERPQVICETKSGKKLYLTFSCSAIQTDVEGVKDFAYVGRDVTEQKRVQQRQRVQYATTRILSESTTLNEIPRKILEAIGKNLGWDLGEFWIPGQTLETQSNEHETRFGSALLRCVKLWVQPEFDFQVFTTVTQQISFASGVGLPGNVWATNSPQ